MSCTHEQYNRYKSFKWRQGTVDRWRGCYFDPACCSAATLKLSFLGAFPRINWIVACIYPPHRFGKASNRYPYPSKEGTKVGRSVYFCLVASSCSFFERQKNESKKSLDEKTQRPELPAPSEKNINSPVGPGSDIYLSFSLGLLHSGHWLFVVPEWFNTLKWLPCNYKVTKGTEWVSSRVTKWQRD